MFPCNTSAAAAAVIGPHHIEDTVAHKYDTTALAATSGGSNY
jgi:hypothetical protein